MWELTLQIQYKRRKVALIIYNLAKLGTSFNSRDVFIWSSILTPRELPSGEPNDQK